MYNPFALASRPLLAICSSLLLAYAVHDEQPESGVWPQRVDWKSGEFENTWQVGQRVYSGSQPKSATALQLLAKNGIRTVVSVDGMIPDVEAAEAAGLRYVHIPIGYDSIPIAAQRQLMSVSDQVQGKIYVHCHHGKHRGPSAAAVLCMLEDRRPRDAALRILHQAGTANYYAGLWDSVREFDRQLVQSSPATPLTTSAAVPPTASAMVQIDRHFTRLKELAGAEASGDKSIHIGELAVLSAELLHELSRTNKEDADQRLVDDYRLAGQLFRELDQLVQENKDGLSRPALMRQLLRISQSCQRCHRKFRN